jgi:hypothetical protein
MQLVMRTMLGVVLATACSGSSTAEESKSSWWPFGGKEETAEPTAPPVEAPSVAPEAVTTDAESDSWFKWPSLPELTWPTFTSDEEGTTQISPDTSPKPTRRRQYGYGKAARPPRNSWAKKDPAEQPAEPTSSPWQAMTDGARRVGDTTTAAWHKTIDAVTPGESEPPATPQVAQQAPKKSWWNWWGSEESEPQGPRTVTEWMAQERLDP